MHVERARGGEQMFGLFCLQRLVCLFVCLSVSRWTWRTFSLLSGSVLSCARVSLCCVTMTSQAPPPSSAAFSCAPWRLRLTVFGWTEKERGVALSVQSVYSRSCQLLHFRQETHGPDFHNKSYQGSIFIYKWNTESYVATATIRA